LGIRSPAEARRLVEKLEIHYTPRHGSWLNVAEKELSVLARQCPDRLLLDQGALAAADRDLLEGVVRRHLEKHGQDAERSLAAVATPEGVCAYARKPKSPARGGPTHERCKHKRKG
jgi:hypothetical protein